MDLRALWTKTPRLWRNSEISLDFARDDKAQAHEKALSNRSPVRKSDEMPLSLQLGLTHLISEVLLTVTHRSRSRTGKKQDRGTLRACGW